MPKISDFVRNLLKIKTKHSLYKPSDIHPMDQGLTFFRIEGTNVGINPTPSQRVDVGGVGMRIDSNGNVGIGYPPNANPSPPNRNGDVFPAQIVLINGYMLANGQYIGTATGFEIPEEKTSMGVKITNEQEYNDKLKDKPKMNFIKGKKND